MLEREAQRLEGYVVKFAGDRQMTICLKLSDSRCGQFASSTVRHTNVIARGIQSLLRLANGFICFRRSSCFAAAAVLSFLPRVFGAA